MCCLRSKIKIWEEWLLGDDENSIRNQIFSMIWNAAVFEVVKTAHNQAFKRGGENALPNWAVSDLILYSYFEIQVSAIMRLLDDRNKPDIISLKRLIKDIKKIQRCLTRKNLLDALGLTYDYEAGLASYHIHNDHNEFDRCCRAESMHKRIDRLVGVSAVNQRKPTDIIRESLLEWIYKWLEAADLNDIREYRHKFVAHAASPESRKWKDTNDFKISLGKISQAHRIICQTAVFLAENILGKSIMQFFPNSGRDVFENLDNPLAAQEDISTLRDQWNAYKQNTEEWINWDWLKDFNKRTEN
jgi:hypothetical protein